MRADVPLQSSTDSFEYSKRSLKNLKGITIAGQNICSLTHKFDDIEILLKASNLDIFPLSETFLNNSISDAEIQIDGYKLYRYDRNLSSGKGHGGGLVTYTKENRPTELLGSFCSPNIETLWLQLKLPNSRPTVICNLYRPPDTNVESSLNELFDQFFQLEITHRSDIIIIGDMNIDMCKASPNKAKLIKVTKQLRLEQMITSPTRIASQTSTPIDHIWCNNPNLYAHRGVIDTGLSDHSLIFCLRKKAKISRKKHVIEITSRRHFDEIAFARDVGNIDWSPVFNEISTCQ